MLEAETARRRFRAKKTLPLKVREFFRNASTGLDKSHTNVYNKICKLSKKVGRIPAREGAVGFFAQLLWKGGVIMLENKNVVTVIILSIVTCGIYALIWSWKTMNALHNQGQKSLVDPIVQFILLFFYIGYIVFALCADANLNSIREQRGLATKDNKILYLILALVFPIALIAIVQNDINELA